MFEALHDLTPSLKFLYPPQPKEIWRSSQEFEEYADSTHYIAELKKNGWRCVVHIENDNVVFWSRHAKPINGQFDEPALLKIKEQLIEVFGDLQPLIFDAELLQYRLEMEKGKLYLLDMPFVKGKSRRSQPLFARRDEMFDRGLPEIQHVASSDQCIFVPRPVSVGVQGFFDAIDDPTVEGIVMKNRSSKYPIFHKEGQKYAFWLKVLRKRLDENVYGTEIGH